MSKELIVMIASLMPEEMVIEQIESCAKEYKLTGSKETKEKLRMYCHLLATKEMIEKQGIDKLMKDVEMMGDIYNRVKTQHQ